ncbi:hypothetical protein VHP8226_04196 [Vibrio hippocampi]|uniref:Uncharacterized protein n=1 Tax=Vibrio hippocampi TaxID=654686 RepID=A0ABN8DPY2_9VIBR|nr:hypothetical protein VHP8226_04196 [Vibrio hippocampi]
MKWDVPTIDARKGPPATPRWPIHVEGDSRLEFVQAQDGSGDILTDFDVKDTSTVEVTRNNGTKAVIFGPDTQSKYLRMSHYVADYFDNEKFVGRNESIDVASETMLYRVNFGALGLEDYTVLGMPENWAFGQLHVTATDLYVTQDITLTKDGSPSYRRVSVDRGQTWKSWSQIG